MLRSLFRQQIYIYLCQMCVEFLIYKFIIYLYKPQIYQHSLQQSFTPQHPSFFSSFSFPFAFSLCSPTTLSSCCLLLLALQYISKKGISLSAEHFSRRGTPCTPFRRLSSIVDTKWRQSVKAVQASGGSGAFVLCGGATKCLNHGS